ncbi:phage tail protein [Serratia marcescens]|uniref:phage tail protein n=1 Tax=Serratia marcescens TaxID=615 RepID=UPI000666A5CF|nr:phage tail protein [Serratia marcescens]MBN5318711.1 phage tail protein [Serratia marcescens]
MMKKYYSVITTIGAARLADAVATGTMLDITEMAVGDGGGVLPRPNPEQTALINEVFREPLNRLSITSAATNVVEAEMIIPAQRGGWWMREVALFTSDGACIAVGNMPESYKPLTTDGSSRTAAVRMQLMVSSTSNIELIIDPSVVIATQQDVTAAKNEAKDYTDEALTELDESIKNAIADAVKGAIRDAWEQDNPVGSSRLFNQNVNPNNKWPWSTWEYAGEHLTIRTAKADGSDVGTQGGSDTVNITRANLPQSVLNVSGSTAEQPAQTLKAKMAGRHAHQGGMNGPGEQYGETVTGTDNSGRYALTWTSENGDHEHDVDVPAHAHTVWAQTEALGQGQAINVVERHKLQMLWHRVA